MEEVRIKDEKTGGEKGMKLARFSLIPVEFLWELAEHYGRGAKKYEDRNWERGYKWSLSLDAHSRHLSQWLMGEDNDVETGTSHLVAAAWHLIALWFFGRFQRGTDDVRSTRSNRSISHLYGQGNYPDASPSHVVKRFISGGGGSEYRGFNCSCNLAGCNGECQICSGAIHSTSGATAS